MAKSPWARLPASSSGNPTSEPIYTSVGHALHTWEILQNHLTGLFVAIVGSSSYTLFRAFGTLVNVHPKIDMLRYAARSSIIKDQELLKKTEKFLNKVNSFIDRRNDIAHGVATKTTGPDSKIAYFLCPSVSTSRKVNISSKGIYDYKWSSTAIDSYADKFEQLATEATLLRTDIIAFLKTT